jgi:hypothetical protein
VLDHLAACSTADQRETTGVYLPIRHTEELQDLEEILEAKTSKLSFTKLCLRNYRIAETVLIRGTQQGLNLYQISKIIYKMDHDGEPSQLEKLVARAVEIFNIVRTSLNKSVYMQLQNIHNKEARGADCGEKPVFPEEIGKSSKKKYKTKNDSMEDQKGSDKEESLTMMSNNRKAFVESIRVESKYLAPAPERKKFQSLQRSNSLQGALRLAIEEQDNNNGDLPIKKHELSPFLAPMKKHFSKGGCNEQETMLKKISENSTLDETPQKKKNTERSISRKNQLMKDSTEGIVRRISNPDLRNSDSSKHEREESTRRKSKKVKEFEGNCKITKLNTMNCSSTISRTCWHRS